MDILIKNIPTVLWLAPLVLYFLIFRLPNGNGWGKFSKILKTSILFAALIIAGIVWYVYPNEGEILFKKSIPWISALNIFYDIGVDQVSLSLISTIIMTSVLFQIASAKRRETKKESLILVLESLAILVFIALDGFLFLTAWFLFGAVALIILSNNRISSRYFILYLIQSILLASVVIYASIVSSGSFNIVQWFTQSYPIAHQKILFALISVAFMFQMGIWPISILTKDIYKNNLTTVVRISLLSFLLGFYGFYRIANPLLYQALNEYAFYLRYAGLAILIYSAFASLTNDNVRDYFRSIFSTFCAFILIGFGCLNERGFLGGFFAALILAFLVTASSFIFDSDKEEISTGLIKKKTFTLLSVILTGAPLTGLFVAYYILISALNDAGILPTILFIFGIIIFAAANVRLIVKIAYAGAEQATTGISGSDIFVTISIIIAIVVIFAEGILPTKLIDKISMSNTYYLGLIDRTDK